MVTALQLQWYKTVEFIPFDLSELKNQTNIGSIRTVERWSKPYNRWVEYAVSSSVTSAEGRVIFELVYEKAAQNDSFVKKNSAWGTTTIVHDIAENSWKASWKGEESGSGDGDAEVTITTMPDIAASSGAECEPSDLPKNRDSPTKFLASLNCDLRIGFYWSAMSNSEDRVIVTIWDDQLKNGRYVLLPHHEARWTKLPGAHELRKHIPIAMRQGVEVLGLRCVAKDTRATTRSRAYYNDMDLLVLSITEEDDGFIATVVGEVTVDEARLGPIPERAKEIVTLISDLDDLPSGVAVPQRMSGIVSGFLRDRTTRNFVVKRANGRCEYCGARGFKMRNGTHYVEAHHVTSLSNNGADHFTNIIALCPAHHREAHYGVDAEKLNGDMMKKLKNIVFKRYITD